MDPLKIIRKHCDPGSLAYHYLVEHGKMVQKKALQTAKKVPDLKPDVRFIREASLLHDIGMIKTRAPDIGCHGAEAYIRHGVLGREILEREGLPRHALVCERHLGVGITRDNVIKQRLPLPERDMVPLTLEEKIICFADKFFGKHRGSLHEERTPGEAMEKIRQYDPKGVKVFRQWLRLFGRVANKHNVKG